MKIVILVDYSDSNFNKDFKLSNMLINEGHNVFLAINKDQFNYFMPNCDKSIIGKSAVKTRQEYSDLLFIAEDISIEDAIQKITK